MAAVQLQQADLKGAHLEGSSLEYANLEGADLWYARLEGAFLWHTYLQGARLYEAHLAGAHLDRLVLAGENQVGPRLVDTHWEDANLAVVDWSQMRLLGEEDEARQEKREGKVKDRPTRLVEYEAAVRANRQLALALQAQGLSEEAARFSYRAQVLHRQALWLEGLPKLGQYLFSLFLAALTGYGYRMGRILVAYPLLVVLFASLYLLFGVLYAPPHLDWPEALIASITAFHGRVFSSAFLPGSPQSTAAAFEAVTGLIFEGVFIAMLTQRFFGR